MFKLDRNNPGSIKELFSRHTDSLVWSYFDNQFGFAVSDSEKNPTCAAIYCADFVFLAGNPVKPLQTDKYSNGAIEIVSYFSQPEKRGIIFVSENPDWVNLIKNMLDGRYRIINRYAIKKEGTEVFNPSALKALTDIKYRIKRIGSDEYDKCAAVPLFSDFVSNFDSKDDFLKRGVGFVALDGDKIVSGASSYTMYNGGIEIEVDTDENYRNQGIAAACASTLILYCLDNGLYPSWDAANMTSVRLAERLGYHFDREYLCYELI